MLAFNMAATAISFPVLANGNRSLARYCMVDPVAVSSADMPRRPPKVCSSLESALYCSFDVIANSGL